MAHKNSDNIDDLKQQRILLQSSHDFMTNRILIIEQEIKPAIQQNTSNANQNKKEGGWITGPRTTPFFPENLAGTRRQRDDTL
jgi:hypothetical protein